MCNIWLYNSLMLLVGKAQPAVDSELTIIDRTTTSADDTATTCKADEATDMATPVIVRKQFNFNSPFQDLR